LTFFKTTKLEVLYLFQNTLSYIFTLCTKVLPFCAKISAKYIPVTNCETSIGFGIASVARENTILPVKSYKTTEAMGVFAASIKS